MTQASVRRGLRWSAATALAAALALTGCGKSGSSGSAEGSGKKTTVANIGSDTMVNLAAAWAEAYGAIDKSVLIEVNGGGSGVGEQRRRYQPDSDERKAQAEEPAPWSRAADGKQEGP